MTIRHATIEDIPALLVLGAHMHAESPRFSQLTFSADKLTETLHAVLESPLGLLDVAEADGQIVGVAMGMAFQHWCSTDNVATDLAVFVEPSHRGGALSVRLVKHFIEWLHSTGAAQKIAGVSTGIHTEQTARLYERLGMRRFGVMLEA